jgi:hypothetical protein
MMACLEKKEPTWPQRFGLPAEDPEITKMRRHSTIIWRDAQVEWPKDETWIVVVTKEDCDHIKLITTIKMMTMDTILFKDE